MVNRAAPFILALAVPLYAAVAEQQPADAGAAAPAASRSNAAMPVDSPSPAAAAAPAASVASVPIAPEEGASSRQEAKGEPTTAPDIGDERSGNAGPTLLDPSAAGTASPDPLTPPEVATPPPNAPGTPSVTDQRPRQAQIDPVLVLTRVKIGAIERNGRAAEADDAAGLATYYIDTDTLLWTNTDGITQRGHAALHELAKADDWGLDTARLEIPTPPAANARADELADFEIALSRAVLTYARHARGGRIDPRSLSPLFDRKPRVYLPKTVLAGLAAASAPGAYLQGLHPRHRQFGQLRQALLALNTPVTDTRPIVRLPDGPSLKRGDKHPHVALLRKRLNSPAADAANSEIYDEALAAAVESYQKASRLTVDGIVGSGTRDALNGTLPRSKDDQRRLIITNMERWRWMPEDLGRLHVWNNVPEQMARVYDGGQVIFEEKIVVGKPATPTTNFSADMKFVIFNPTWGVPEGIKTNELAPMLRRTTGNDSWFFGGGGGRTASSVLERAGGLKVSIGGRPVNPDTLEWSKIDIRRVSFTQPAGGRNVLGIVKFRFPNKHDIYMHDTPQRHLFNQTQRAFSHGCLRVQNPMRLAEVLLERDKGWSPATVRGHVTRSATHDVTLSTPIPVHVAYFTAVADEHGKLKSYRDIYGVDSRVASALEGRQVRVASAGEQEAEKPTGSRKERRRAKREKRAPTVARTETGNPFTAVFGN